MTLSIDTVDAYNLNLCVIKLEFEDKPDFHFYLSWLLDDQQFIDNHITQPLYRQEVYMLLKYGQQLNPCAQRIASDIQNWIQPLIARSSIVIE